MTSQVAVATAYPIILDGLVHSLSEAGHKVSAVLTRAGVPAIEERAGALGIPVFVLPVRPGETSIAVGARKDPAYAEKVRRALDGFAGTRPRYLVAWGINVLPDFILAMAERAVNVHPSDLPAYRGGFPFQAQILNGESSMRVTTHWTTPRIDSGEVLSKSEAIPILPDDTMTSLVRRAVPTGASLLARTLSGLDAGNLPPPPPPSARADLPHAWGIRRVPAPNGDFVNDGILGRLRVEWDLDRGVDIERSVRAFDMMGGPYTNLGGSTFVIKSAKLEGSRKAGVPGEILAVDGEGIRVQASDAVLTLRGMFKGDGVPPPLAIGAAFESTLPLSEHIGYHGAERVPAASRRG